MMKTRTEATVKPTRVTLALAPVVTDDASGRHGRRVHHPDRHVGPDLRSSRTTRPPSGSSRRSGSRFAAEADRAPPPSGGTACACICARWRWSSCVY